MHDLLQFQEHETFRDELASVRRDGRRRWVYARQPSGRYYRARTLVSVGLLAFLFLAPFVTFKGEPLVLLNLLERRFVVFGLVFWPQDFYLVVLCALSLLVTILLSAATIGRIWCGWLCPQTVFLEMVFRRIEYAIDGSAAAQLRRDKAPLTFAAWRRVGTASSSDSFVIANVFLHHRRPGARDHRHGTAGRAHRRPGVDHDLQPAVLRRVCPFREQACTLACPYGRMMSAFTDTHTITVTYDWKRGEPRGKAIKLAAARGDCVDCAQCVTVCPTGIDIRNGIQLECVNCTACMDACDDVMRRLQRRPGLIRLTSHDAVRDGRASWLTGRVAAYAAVWAVLVGTTATLLAIRHDLDVRILRQPGTVYAMAEADSVANL